MIYTAACAAACILISYPFYADPRLTLLLFDAGVDALGALLTAALFFGCMRQDGDGASEFRYLVVLVSTGFIVNECMLYTMLAPELTKICFTLILVSKLLDLVLIYFFYRYVRKTLDFKGKLASWAKKGIPTLMALEAILELANIFYPVTFFVDATGTYYATNISWAEDIYLIAASIITSVLIVRSTSPRNQKTAALTFILIPLVNYLLSGGQFGNASQYGTVLMSLVVMYCIIFNEKNSKLAATQTELNMATEIQASMLPSIFPAFPEREEFDLYASMDPAKAVGGDFYDFFMVDDEHLACVMADVSGKGVPAALFMMISKTVVQNYAKMGISAGEVLTRANAALCAENKMEMFVTVWIGILEVSTGRMVCSSAGHEYPAIYRDGTFELFKDKHGLVLGGMDIARYRDYEIQLGKGDKIFVYTDGVPEATDENNELFGTDRMIEALNSEPGADPRQLLKNVRASVDAFVGAAEQFDDLTMLCVEYRGVQ